MSDSADPDARPTPLDASVAARMSKQRRRDTAPEVSLRRLMHASGLRFRVDAPLPTMPRRRADVLLSAARIAVFVDGCFWHGCPLHGTLPRNNAEWWHHKIAGNVARDQDTDSRLQHLGWTPVRVWEHEDMQRVATDVRALWLSRVTRP